MSLSRAPVRLVRSISLVDVFLLIGACVFIYALIGVAQEWGGPYRPKTEISLGFLALLKYSFLSLVRVFAAYFLSLVFTFTYGYWAAKSKRAEPILISLLDILQSVPVLGFMPGLVLALVNLFPRSNMGLELATVLMVFTCEGWNMVFSFYSSVKSVPQDLKDVASIFRLKKRDLFRDVEVPFAMNGLLWNSMLSMAGGWFYLMVMESFTLGDKDFRLPGIGSYMAVAYEKHDYKAVTLGIMVMFILIALVDRCLWAPLVAWSDRFRYDRDPQGNAPRSLVLEWFKRSNLLASYYRRLRQVKHQFDDTRHNLQQRIVTPDWEKSLLSKIWLATRIGFAIFGLLMLLYGLRSMYGLLAASTAKGWLLHLRNTFYTFLRVIAAVILGSLWTIPVGVFIGTNPQWTRRLQPVVQIVASFPAPMVFPLITYALIKIGLSFEIGSIVLMLFASQWYILFNVISGATLIPQPMLEVAEVFQLKGWNYWKSLILPAVFPSLVNGWITAAGGAWNSCIVSEYVLYGNRMLSATGIGASISEATQQANFAALAGATVVLITTVVLLNRFFWGSLYRLAETRFRLD